MDRRPPRSTTDGIDLYIRTYYSLLRSSGDVWVRAFEEAHSFSESSLHAGARDARPDLAAFAYSAARLPESMPQIRRVVMGQSEDQFESAGLPVRRWPAVRTRGRRRATRFDGASTLAVFVTSASDIDDLIPIITAYQIEWNKLHAMMTRGSDQPIEARLLAAGLSKAEVGRLAGALGGAWPEAAQHITESPCDIAVRLLAGSFSEYQTTAHRWWRGVEKPYLAPGQGRRPVYFVSSNTHSLINLLGGYARAHRDQIDQFARTVDPEGLAQQLEDARARGDEGTACNIYYYLLRAYLDHGQQPRQDRLAEVQAFDAESGIVSVESPGRIDVSAQLISLAQLRADRIDPRVRVDGFERLAQSQAVIINIDYPLGMAAYHHLARVAQGVGEIRGVYVMGKAATLNGRVGDVMISTTVYDEHSRNTYLMPNCFTAADVQPLMTAGTVLDNQKAVTVRSAYLQNRDYMGLFYGEGYTVLEMEAGPYMSAVYELVSPSRHPNDEVVNLSRRIPFELGVLHYASDTPYSRRQSLLSKSMSYFGVDSTYGCSVAIVRNIFRREIDRLSSPS